MPRAEFREYERSETRKRKQKRRDPLDAAALAKNAGIPHSRAFERLVQRADGALKAYDWERKQGRDETRHLLDGIKKFRNALADARNMHRRMRDQFDVIFDGLVLDATGTYPPIGQLEACMAATIDACDATLEANRPRNATKPDASIWVGTPFEIPDPRHARRRLASRLATLFQGYAGASFTPEIYEAHLYEFIKAIFKRCRIQWSDDETVFRKLIPERLRHPAK